MRLAQNGMKGSVRNLLFVCRNDYGQDAIAGSLPKFYMASALGDKNKALAHKDFYDRLGGMKLRHTGACVQ